MISCVIYTRFSPRRNAAESESCETQEAQCRELAKAKRWHVRSCHRDEAVSGDVEVVDRPGLFEAVEALKRGDVLLVYRRDRLARDPYLAEALRRMVAAKAGRIEAVDGEVVAGDDMSPGAVLVRGVLDLVAQFERGTTKARTRAAMRTQQRQGKRVGRFAPYGYSIDPKDRARLVPNAAEEQAVARIKALALEGLNPYRIAQRMQAEAPELARGKVWGVKLVRKIVERA